MTTKIYGTMSATGVVHFRPKISERPSSVCRLYIPTWHSKEEILGVPWLRQIFHMITRRNKLRLCGRCRTHMLEEDVIQAELDIKEIRENYSD